MTIAILNQSLRRKSKIKTSVHRCIVALCNDVSRLEERAANLRIAIAVIGGIRE